MEVFVCFIRTDGAALCLPRHVAEGDAADFNLQPPPLLTVVWLDVSAAQ